MNPIRPAAAAVGAALLLGACAGLPRATPAPALRSAAPLAEATMAGAPAGAWPRQQWWRRYQDPTLDELVQRALDRSPTIDTARARFDTAQQQLRLASAARGVQIDASATAERQRLSDNGMFPPAFLGFHWYNQLDLGVRARYVFDWWGRQRAEIAAAVDSARAAQAEASTAALALAAAVSDTYFGWQADQQRIALARERLDVAEHALRITTARVAAGLDRDDAAQRASALRAAAEEQLAAFEGSAELRRVLLAALLGCAPAELPPLAARPLPATAAALPANASIDLIARRADITASRWRVEAAVQNVKAARAQFLPDISLNALAALSSIDYGKLFEYGSRAPAAGVAVHLPLFDAGLLRAQHGARQAELRAAIASYDETLIAAARDVGQQVAIRQQLAARAAARAAQAQAVGRVVAAAHRRVEQGVSDLRAELDATQSEIDQRAAALELDAAAIAADIALTQALGGGFEANGNAS